MIITFVNINVLWFSPSLVNLETFFKLLRCLLSNYVPEKTNKQTKQQQQQQQQQKPHKTLNNLKS